ncbi:beta-ketoacyl-ACP synthase III [Paenibacillus campi]|uniref:beta-ketoacyl-ACP synthase III n=1 Tax=Paenibacillus campi TaxID=3106031 RepID=UPI002AFE128F|nr:beta-ketoacyl-ACP synthase III [Paenibacillus sp. SGZ-1009]
MQYRKVKILGTGKYMPRTAVTDEQVDHRLGVKPGWAAKAGGVGTRYYVSEGETASSMGAAAAKMALEAAGLAIDDIDCLVCTSGTKEQPLPSTASFIQQALGAQDSGIPVFDMDATCLSFLVGLDTMSYLVAAGRYRHILLVASEVASAGLDWSHKESAILFGDGAAAVVIGPAVADEAAAIIHTSLHTYSRGARYSEIPGGGTRFPPERPQPSERSFLFQMDGTAIFKMASRLLPGFMDELLSGANTTMDHCRLVIPHQGSAMAMRVMRKKLGIAEQQFMNITPNHGNTIAASIPMGLHEAIVQQRIQRGDRLLLLGTAAGLTIGGMVLDY